MRTSLSRRQFGRTVAGSVAAAAQFSVTSCGPDTSSPRSLGELPNIILAMADDLGWGDTGYNGHPQLRTPYLDEMARTGLRFDRFYAAAPVCSPTRGSCLTGRHPSRYGIFHANAGGGPSLYSLPKEEVTLGEAVKPLGYGTGHFGKWHLGDFEGEQKSSPSDHGFDEWFSTVRKVSTFEPEGYWHNGELVTETLEGDDSAIIVSRALDFINRAVAERRPFLAVLWFHTPHLPVISKGNHQIIYNDHPGETSNYWGAVSAMDEQIGRLRRELRRRDIADNTMLWFASDNGPEGAEQSDERPGSAGRFRGRKRSLFEGGIRVPGILEWPARITEGRTVKMPVVTSDYYPTILDILGLDRENQPRPLDGISLLPLIEGRITERPQPIAFETGRHRNRTPTFALIGNHYKLISQLDQSQDLLFDLQADPAESTNLLRKDPDRAQAMREQLEEWRTSCARSLKGEDYR